MMDRLIKFNFMINHGLITFNLNLPYMECLHDGRLISFNYVINHEVRHHYKIDVTAIATSIHTVNIYSHLRLTKLDIPILHLDIFTAF